MVVSLMAIVTSNNIVSINELLLKKFSSSITWFNQQLENKTLLIDVQLNKQLENVLVAKEKVLFTIGYNESINLINDSVVVTNNVSELTDQLKSSTEVVVLVNNLDDYIDVLPNLSRLYLLHVDVEDDSSVELSDFILENWRSVFNEFHDADNNNMSNYCFEILEKITE